MFGSPDVKRYRRIVWLAQTKRWNKMWCSNSESRLRHLYNCMDSGIMPGVFGFWFSSFCPFFCYRGRGAETGLGWENLHVGVVSRHRLNSLNVSNDLPKKIQLYGVTVGVCLSGGT